MLKSSLMMLAIIFLSLSFSNVSASNSALSQQEEECYAVAMVAYDTVINSGLGLPLDQVIDSMVKNSTAMNTIDIYQDFLMLVVMDAYNWQGSPHTYAVKTLFKCAAEHTGGAHTY